MGLGWWIGHVNQQVNVAVAPTTPACSVSNAPWDTTRTQHARVRVLSFVLWDMITIKMFSVRCMKSLFSSQHASARERALLMSHVTQTRVSACVTLAWRDKGVTVVSNLTRPFLIVLVITKSHIDYSIVSSHACLVATCIMFHMLMEQS